MGSAGRHRLERCANDRIGNARSKQILKKQQHDNAPRRPELGKAPAGWPEETKMNRVVYKKGGRTLATLTFSRDLQSMQAEAAQIRSQRRDVA